jgi:hypothetical protein
MELPVAFHPWNMYILPMFALAVVSIGVVWALKAFRLPRRGNIWAWSDGFGWVETDKKWWVW